MTSYRDLKDPVNAFFVGKAAEHFVCFDLLSVGVEAFLSDQGLPYDVICDVDSRLIRLQVKGCTSPRNMNATGRNERIGYTFHVRRRGKNGRGKRLDSSHCDLVACVALDIMAVRYMRVETSRQTIQFASPGTNYPRYTHGVERGEMISNTIFDAMPELKQ